MHLTTIALSQMRGAESLTLELDPKLTVLVGINGTGKTTILDAIATQLGWIINKVKNAGHSAKPLVQDDIRIGQRQASIRSELIWGDLPKVTWESVLTRTAHKQEDKNDVRNLDAVVRLIQERIEIGAKPNGIPVFAYYPVKRAGLDIPERIRTKHDFAPANTYDHALTKQDAGFRIFFEWWRLMEDMEREFDNIVKNPLAQAVRSAIPQFLNGFTNLRIRRTPPQCMVVSKQGQDLVVDQLSDGEKCLLGVVADLSRRLAMANPGSSNPLLGEGVVLIDELDLHLHPRWQRKVIPALMKTFPNCQFVITTHSPQVVAHTPTDSLRLLSQEDNRLVCNTASRGFGMDSNRILLELMGTDERPPEIQAKLDEIHQKIGAGLLAEAEPLIALLQDEIGSDPELDGAMAAITRRRILGR